ncbi:MAG: AAA family ATPase [Proteobacteria bacterium]|nr:AAA family ATPase [Pseudomonadota bacterium]
MHKLQDYEIREKLAETRNATVYQAILPGENNTVIIKTLKTPITSPHEIAQVKQEYEFIRNIDLDGVITTHEYIYHDGRFSLVLEDFNGVSLKSTIESDKTYDIRSFLYIAIKLSETLGELHKRNIVHKDIKPHNILVNTFSGKVKIADFGISSMLNRDIESIYDTDVIQGTLLYMSPEQTGRMNRTVDYRADLYSLGITFYEMLTGKVPFLSKDPLEVIHSHIAKIPVPPIEKNDQVPKVVSDIIVKLLSKNAEDRYQNGFGLAFDLKACLKQLQEQNAIKEFELATHDISNRFIIPQKLYGREKDIALLLSTFTRVNQENISDDRIAGSAHILLVSGSAGIGKSALINEIRKPITEKRGYFITGKYEQFRRDKPYSAIIQAFQELVRQILVESENRIRIWKNRIEHALGVNAGIITDIIPDLELIIGEKKDTQELAPMEARNRFHVVFENFINVFARREHPVTLFIDDLQWADLPSLQLIKNAIVSPAVKYLFFIGSYRDNEVLLGHPLFDTFSQMEKSGVNIERIVLSEIELEDISDLIVNLLKCSKDRVQSLAELVYKKTGGNPFFVNEFLHTLYSEGLIKVDASLGWQWDIDSIIDMQVTDNVVDLMADKIGRLPKQIQDVLKVASCIGNRFDLEMILLLMDMPVETVLTVLSDAMAEGFISMRSDYIFHHDRIQEAAYSLISDEERPSFHYRIGKLVDEKTPEDQKQDKLFYIVDQLNLGEQLIKGRAARYDLSRMNLACAKKAKASIAYAAASGYLDMGIRLLTEDCWETQYDLALDLYTEAVAISSLQAEYEKMERLTEIALAKSRSLLDKVNIYKVKIGACIAQGDIGGALTAGTYFAELTGRTNTGSEEEIRSRYREFKKAFSGKTDEDILNLPVMTDPVLLASMQIGSQLAYVLYNIAPNILISAMIRNVVESLEYGLCTEIGPNYSALGIVLISAFNDIEEGVRFGELGMKMAERKDARNAKSTIIYVYNTQIRHWKEHLRNTIDAYTEGYHLGLETGNLLYAADCLGMQDNHRFRVGEPLYELEKDVEDHLRLMKNMNQMPIFYKNLIGVQLIKNLMGKNTDPKKIIGEAFDEEKMVAQYLAENNRLLLAGVYDVKLFLSTMFHDYENMGEYVEKEGQYIESVAASFVEREYAFFNSIYQLATYPDVSTEEKEVHLEIVQENLKKMKKWAKYAPMNILHLYHLIRAERFRVLGKNRQAEKEYDIAIALSREYEYLYDEMYANELAGRYYLSIGKETFAMAYMIKAYRLCEKWGAAAKLSHMKDMYPALLSEMGRLSSMELDGTDHTITGSSLKLLDLSTVTKASQTLSGEVALGSLLQKMMRIIMENAGAQRGFAILSDHGMLFVEAEGSMENREAKVLNSIPVEDHDGLSLSMVNYVARTRQSLILHDASSKGQFIKDPYVIKNHPKSVLCVPVINQGNLTGILYLENNVSTHTFTPDRIEVLNILSSQIAISIDNARLYENLEEKVAQRTQELHKATEALWGEMVLAKKIQSVLLPKNPVISGYEVIGYMAPAEEIGGDYYDIIHAGSMDWVIIGDVSGHGVPAGLIMMMAQTAIHTVVKNFPDPEPSTLIKMVNTVITENIKSLGESKYMTLTVALLDRNGGFHYSGLHQDIFIHRHGSNTVETIPTKGMWIGILDDINDMVSDNSLQINKGDTMLLFTDGLTEAREKKSSAASRFSEEDMFGDDQLKTVFCHHVNGPIEGIKKGIMDALSVYLCTDDITFVLLRRIEESN